MGLVRTLYIHTERTFRPFAVGITGNPRFILSHKHNVVVLGILINQSFLIELLNQFFRDVSLTEIGLALATYRFLGGSLKSSEGAATPLFAGASPISKDIASGKVFPKNSITNSTG